MNDIDRDPADQLAEALDRSPAVVQGIDEELANLVHLARTLQDSSPGPMSADRRAAARARLLSRIEPAPQVVAGERSGLRLQKGFALFPGRLVRKLALPVFLILVSLLLFTGSGVAYAAQDTLPGDYLYVVKELMEDGQIAFASETEDAILYDQFLEQRIVEIDRLIAKGRYADIEMGLQRFQEQQMAAVLLAETSSKDYADNQAGAAIPPVLESTQHQTTVLTELLDQVPVNAQDSIHRAIQSSSKNQERLEQIFGDDQPGKQPEEKQVDPSDEPPGKKPEENPGKKPSDVPGQGKP